MAKFNVVQKRRRAAVADRKRATKGEPFTGKLKVKPQPQSISGKRKRKLFKKWRRVSSPPLSLYIYIHTRMYLFYLSVFLVVCVIVPNVRLYAYLMNRIRKRLWRRVLLLWRMSRWLLQKVRSSCFGMLCERNQMSY